MHMHVCAGEDEQKSKFTSAIVNVTVIIKICTCKSNSCITSFRKSHSTIVSSILCYAWAHFYNFNLNKTYENVAKVVELFMQTDLSLCNLVHKVAISSLTHYSILTCELNMWQTAKICNPSLPCKHMQHCASMYHGASKKLDMTYNTF